MIDRRNFSDKPIKNDQITYKNIWKSATNQRDDYTTGCLLDLYFKQHYNLIAIDLSKQEKLDPNRKSIRQNNFTKNIEINATIFFINEEAKELVLDFWKGTVKKLWFYFCFNIILT